MLIKLGKLPGNFSILIALFLVLASVSLYARKGDHIKVPEKSLQYTKYLDGRRFVPSLMQVQPAEEDSLSDFDSFNKKMEKLITNSVP